MLFRITDGTVTLDGAVILDHIDFEIKDTEKIAVVGRNGAGKTTLLRLLNGDIGLDRDDKREGSGIYSSRKLSTGMLRQQVFPDESITVEEELLASCPCKDTFDRERFEYEREYDILFTGFGLKKEDKTRPLSSFSGGERTKIALIKLLLEKPDILILDEPTNHLDIETTEWLEKYLRTYEKAVVAVSHDRFFIDRIADVVYESDKGKLTRYAGNYTQYKEEKQKKLKALRKAYIRQEEERERLEDLVKRFKDKPNKASFARAKKKQIERLPKLEKPDENTQHIFTGELEPLEIGNKWVIEAEHLKIGYDKPLLEISLRVQRGQKIGIIGPNGIGKTTFLKTIANIIAPLSGELTVGDKITAGYFDQDSAQISSKLTVAEHFHKCFPSYTEKEVRTILGEYLFGGKEASKIVDSLSGGEKARLVLAELMNSRPNLLLLDEPTNHMDIEAKETLESAFKAYTGTIIFISHDRYFINQVAKSLLIFDEGAVSYYPFGYEHYLNRKDKEENGGSVTAQIQAEDEALIAGMRAVPKAESRNLKEIPEEEAYEDWKMRLALEALKEADRQVEALDEKRRQMVSRWQESEEFWNGQVWSEREEYEKLIQEYEKAVINWNKKCIEWSDARREEEM